VIFYFISFNIKDAIQRICVPTYRNGPENGVAFPCDYDGEISTENRMVFCTPYPKTSLAPEITELFEPAPAFGAGGKNSEDSVGSAAKPTELNTPGLDSQKKVSGWEYTCCIETPITQRM